GGGFQHLAIAAIDDDLAAGLRQACGTGTAEPLAGGADDGLAAGDAEIHGVLPGVTLIRRPAGPRFRGLPWRGRAPLSIGRHPAAPAAGSAGRGPQAV